MSIYYIFNCEILSFNQYLHSVKITNVDCDVTLLIARETYCLKTKENVSYKQKIQCLCCWIWNLFHLLDRIFSSFTHAQHLWKYLKSWLTHEINSISMRCQNIEYPIYIHAAAPNAHLTSSELLYTCTSLYMAWSILELFTSK